ncbi:protein TRIGALACTOSYLDIACYLGLYCEROL 4, chloroplastic-like [Quillaja saponaria]|uniref:Protein TRIGALACTOSYLDIACYLGLYCEROL 4, chloroplastic-like n=1 Tax=Quillaja saponaria TaxID=32244 RepID=A0AAD7LCS3_QUISA|nr:protein TRIGALACTOSYLDIACYLGLYCEROL 4, chloroplastic-like [Quillaja saponaria]
MEMRKLRWAMDGGGFWDLDVSTPKTLDGLAFPVPGDPLPLGLSRGTRLSRPKQLHFMQRFMTAPFIPSYATPHGFSLQRVLTIPFFENWFVTFLGQFNLQKFLSFAKTSRETPESASSWLQTHGIHLHHKSLYALGFCSEFLLTPDDTLLLGFDAYGHTDKPRKKAVFHHKFPQHDLTVEAEWPGLFVDKTGNYWDVPLSMSVDLASVAFDKSGPSYHLCMHNNLGLPKQFEGDHGSRAPPTLLPGFSIKSALSYKKSIDIWRGEGPKLKLVQPYDMFLSDPHISASAIIGAAVTSAFGDNSMRAQVEDVLQDFRGFCLKTSGGKSSVLADAFGSVSFTAQYGNFQRLFLDLTRFHARLDFPSGTKFLSGATFVAQDLFNSQQPSLEVVQAICPNVTFSLQQQVAGPFSVRVDSGVTIDLKRQDIRADDPVFAVEYALQVLGSAKAIAWYSPKHREFMMELRFFET